MQPQSLLDPRVRPVTFSMVTIIAIFAFEGLAIVAALPSVAVDLGGVELLPWTVTGYLVAVAVATAVFGGVIDAVGVAPVFRIAVVAFGLFSLAAGLAPSMEILVATRVLQGIAGGAMQAVGGTLVVVGFPEHLVGRAAAANSNVWGLFGFASPALAAGLLVFAGWRWIFILMVPITMVTLAFGWRALPKREERLRVRIDWPGVLSLVAAVTSLLVAVSSPSVYSVLWLAAAALLGTVWWRRAGSARQTMIERRYISKTPYSTLIVAVSLTVAAMIGAQTYLPVFVRGSLNATESVTAWSVLFLTLGWTIAANVAGRITKWTTPRNVLLYGVTSGPVWIGLLVLAVWQGAPIWVIFGTYVLMGTAVGTTTNVAWQILKNFVEEGGSGRASSAHQFMRSLGQSIGAGVAGGAILFVASLRLDDLDSLTAALAGEDQSALGVAAAAALEEGFLWAVVAMFVIQLCCALVVWSQRRLVG
ncbi:MAG: MFS transporter [Acidimicrobiia bacterium]|nr:MFS transporter [Acidimicrobiia bacterium]